MSKEDICYAIKANVFFNQSDSGSVSLDSSAVNVKVVLSY